MRRFLYLTAVALSVGLSADAFGQGGGGMSGSGGGFGGGSSFGGGGGSSIGGGGSSFGGGGSSLLGGSGGSSLLGGGSNLGGSSTLGGSGGAFSGGTAFGGGGTSYGGGAGGGRGIAGGSGGFQMSQTNPFSGTFGNPLYYGRPGSTNVSMGQGGQQLKGQGFGQMSFGAVNLTSGTTTGIGGRTGTATIGGNRGLTGGYGGLGGGYGGVGGANSTPQVSYAATVGFRTPPVVVPTVRADLQAMVSRSSAIRVPGNIRVEAVGNVIVLRGKVADEDELRLVEGMVRLEPGVHDVRNELEIGP
jgi:hypothetical protein